MKAAERLEDRKVEAEIPSRAGNLQPVPVGIGSISEIWEVDFAAGFWGRE